MLSVKNIGGYIKRNFVKCLKRKINMKNLFETPQDKRERAVELIAILISIVILSYILSIK